MKECSFCGYEFEQGNAIVSYNDKYYCDPDCMNDDMKWAWITFPEEKIKVDVIKINCKGMGVTENKDRFVRVEHAPSGITVTKYHKSQIKAKKLAMLEINELIDLWENCI